MNRPIRSHFAIDADEDFRQWIELIISWLDFIHVEEKAPFVDKA